jgi:hypothetical protein
LSFCPKIWNARTTKQIIEGWNLFSVFMAEPRWGAGKPYCTSHENFVFCVFLVFCALEQFCLALYFSLTWVNRCRLGHYEVVPNMSSIDMTKVFPMLSLWRDETSVSI